MLRRPLTASSEPLKSLTAPSEPLHALDGLLRTSDGPSGTSDGPRDCLSFLVRHQVGPSPLGRPRLSAMSVTPVPRQRDGAESVATTSVKTARKAASPGVPSGAGAPVAQIAGCLTRKRSKTDAFFEEAAKSVKKQLLTVSSSSASSSFFHSPPHYPSPCSSYPWEDAPLAHPLSAQPVVPPPSPAGQTGVPPSPTPSAAVSTAGSEMSSVSKMAWKTESQLAKHMTNAKLKFFVRGKIGSGHSRVDPDHPDDASKRQYWVKAEQFPDDDDDGDASEDRPRQCFPSPRTCVRAEGVRACMSGCASVVVSFAGILPPRARAAGQAAHSDGRCGDCH